MARLAMTSFSSRRLSSVTHVRSKPPTIPACYVFPQWNQKTGIIGSTRVHDMRYMNAFPVHVPMEKKLTLWILPTALVEYADEGTHPSRWPAVIDIHALDNSPRRCRSEKTNTRESASTHQSDPHILSTTRSTGQQPPYIRWLFNQQKAVNWPPTSERLSLYC